MRKRSSLEEILMHILAKQILVIKMNTDSYDMEQQMQKERNCWKQCKPLSCMQSIQVLKREQSI